MEPLRALWRPYGGLMEPYGALWSLMEPLRALKGPWVPYKAHLPKSRRLIRWSSPQGSSLEKSSQGDFFESYNKAFCG